ncbi:unnamed protein product [Sphenostylis stenocarpa]|uniref:Late embryogenesis abundant protein LEA-2 subgroup domain-containing protein n=1 Tax=Sphenostylis stenocarpa TaxID=92480 RepID=A0AA86RZC3_9FABA|nr:unnamed protein product [Sphenostylis stenocarpa]
MKPHLDLRQLGLQYMATSPNPNRPGPSSANLYFIIRLVFAVVNTNNRVGISCGQSRVTLLYRGTPLGRATMPAFFQHPHTVKEVVATVGVDDVNLSNSDAADFTRDALLNDRVELRVLAHVATKIRLFNLQSPPLQNNNIGIHHRFNNPNSHPSADAVMSLNLRQKQTGNHSQFRSLHFRIP